MREMKTKCGTVFMVDDDIAEANANFAWRLDKHGYVYRKTWINGKPGSILLLHRLVAGVKDPAVYVDHENGNRMDCTRLNLRTTNPTGNSCNRMKAPGRLSQFKGVTWNGARWQVQIGSGGKSFYLGVFDSEHEAGHEYNKAAIKLHGEFARLNPVGHGNA